MSFGFSASDVVLCVRFAHKLWKEAKDAPNDFQNVTTEVANFKLVLDEVQESIAERELDQRKRTELAELINGCTGVLNDLQSLLDKYKSLATQSKRTWDRFRFGKEPIEMIRSRLVSHTTLLMTFHSGLCGGSLARIEKLLEQLALEHRSGLREASVISSDSIVSAEEGDQYVWSQIGRELEDVGITSSMVAKHREFIIEWMKRALLDGQFDEANPAQCNTTTRGHPAAAHVTEDILLKIRRSTSHALQSIRNPPAEILTHLRLLSKLSSTGRALQSIRNPPAEISTHLRLLINLSDFGDEAPWYESNTGFPVTVMSAFKPSLYYTKKDRNHRRLAKQFRAHLNTESRISRAEGIFHFNGT